jgi:hypothetical protein
MRQYRALLGSREGDCVAHVGEARDAGEGALEAEAPTFPLPQAAGLSGKAEAVANLSIRSTEHLCYPVGKSPSPPFRREREEHAQREGEVGGAGNRFVGPPHPALSPRSAGRVGK